MPDRCAVYGCSNQASLENNVSVHRIPFLNDDRVEAKKRRKKWVDFVMTTRDKWEPTVNSAVCSEHFTKDSFQRRFDFSPEGLKKYCPRLLRDEIGILAYPTLHLKHKTKKEPSSRDKRMQKRNVITSLASHSEQPHTKKSKGEEHPTVSFDENEHLDDFCDENFLVEGPSTQLKDVEVQCCLVDKSTRHYKNMWATAKYKLQRCRNELKKCKIKLGYIGCVSESSELSSDDEANEVLGCKNGYDSENDYESENDLVYENESPYDTEDDSQSQSSTEFDINSDSEEHYKRVFATDNNLRSEPKFIVFFTQLLALFKFCPNCKAENPDVEVHQNGTMAKVKCTCTNPKCNNKNFTWTSQPLIPGTRLRAGNFLLSFAIIVATCWSICNQNLKSLTTHGSSLYFTIYIFQSPT
ncbi:THAP domain-containing 5-like [Paramuricea clavata]|uniref:THAP domain-containing 5-like n=1 Tax=Paramuricea clavata TaxID=317549 RepID=A0A6S7ICC8_PARCT|nr:THAP domain-containing 5-like [Paramuricea clavata]